MWDEIMCIWYLFSSCRLKSNQTDMHLSNSLKATMVEYGVLNWSFLLWGSHRKAENIKRNPSKCWTWRPNVRHAPQTTLAIIAAALMNLTLHPMSVNRLLGSATYKLPHQLFGGALQLRPVGNTAGPTPTICPSETAVLAALVPSRCVPHTYIHKCCDSLCSQQTPNLFSVLVITYTDVAIQFPYRQSFI